MSTDKHPRSGKGTPALVLVFTGNGTYEYPGLPMRDLTQADLDAAGVTIEQALAAQPVVYARPQQPAATPREA